MRNVEKTGYWEEGALRRLALEKADDTNEAYLIVHRLVAHALRRAPAGQDVATVFASALKLGVHKASHGTALS